MILDDKKQEDSLTNTNNSIINAKRGPLKKIAENTNTKIDKQKINATHTLELQKEFERYISINSK